MLGARGTNGRLTTIGYYISDYGYGHATRSIALIRTLLLYSPRRYRLMICSGKTLPFIQASLAEYSAEYSPERIEFRGCSSDLGYVLGGGSGSVELDQERFRLGYEQYMAAFSAEVRREADFIMSEQLDMVISDISPIPIAAAAIAGVKSVGISNFTWHTAYGAFLQQEQLAPLHQAYEQLDYFIPLAGSDLGERKWTTGSGPETGFYCRTPQAAEVQRIVRELNPDGSKTIVYFALGMGIETEALDSLSLWKDHSCVFIVSENMQIYGPNIVRIPQGYTESQNYAAAADLIISKPGWGVVGEAVTLGKPLIVLVRTSMTEDRNTIQALQGKHPHMLVTWQALRELNVQQSFPQLAMEGWSRGVSIAMNERRKYQIVQWIEHVANETNAIRTSV
ncbi:UDP-N-acetylglucosamine:LPS N-acetylglucosamine transferase [Paenibacillus algorifonticola]|uniref:UDP-N-acetylglucosamine:LPS N-acetylglucosamine transferase n=1 Tax=Paenibacillus algorifonticola TaxID=684063 RepID=A0A1I2GGF4_9BACL|nr:glycosyltransferase [Paenibacillus algorifonticola]SFF16592.1 UDP-N-acetylglucosamine:LPS N-acetylglucosamine transferase [Paenibacillus algorifonticola]